MIAVHGSGGVRLDAQFSARIQGSVAALAVRSDGMILAGGDFSRANGAARANLARLTEDGGLDGSFAPEADGPVTALELLGGAVAVGGRFTRVSDILAPNLAVLNAAGEVSWGGTSGGVACLAAKGALWAGGGFQSVRGQERCYAAQWSATGELDPVFVPALRPSWAIEAGASAMAVQNDGKLIVGGVFETENGLRSLVRLNTDGTLDLSFGGDCGSMLYVRAIELLGNGQLLVGGLDRDGKGFVRRLRADRSIDPSFTAPVLNGAVHAVAVDARGGIVVGGAFGLVRLRADGSAEPEWSAPVSGVVNALALDGEKRLLAGGYLRVDGEYTGLVRLIDGGTMNPLATNEGFRAVLRVQAGRTYAIEASSDLHSWEEVSTGIATEAGLEVLDENASARRHRFFRARLVQ